jgi:hypothetical protein
MESVNTYRAITTGTILVCAACVMWLGISRETIATMNRDLEALKLRNEKLLSEKLLLEKSLEKDSVKLVFLQEDNHDVRDSLQMYRRRNAQVQYAYNVLSQELNLAKLHEQSLDTELARAQQDTEHARETNAMIRITSGIKSDSLHLLLERISHLTNERDYAVMQTIDQTLVAAKNRNENLTTKARRTKAIIAQVDLPGNLSDLSFSLLHPDGTIINDESNLVAHEITRNTDPSASLRPITSFKQMKTIELIYRPEDKLSPGRYELKIFTEGHYIGTMAILLER